MWKSAFVGVYQLFNWKMHRETLKICIYIYHHPHVRYMIYQSHSPSFDHYNNQWIVSWIFPLFSFILSLSLFHCNLQVFTQYHLLSIFYLWKIPEIWTEMQEEFPEFNLFIIYYRVQTLFCFFFSKFFKILQFRGT